MTLPRWPLLNSIKNPGPKHTEHARKNDKKVRRIFITHFRKKKKQKKRNQISKIIETRQTL